jgi:hypothetical protein
LAALLDLYEVVRMLPDRGTRRAQLCQQLLSILQGVVQRYMEQVIPSPLLF